MATGRCRVPPDAVKSRRRGIIGRKSDIDIAFVEIGHIPTPDFICDTFINHRFYELSRCATGEESRQTEMQSVRFDFNQRITMTTPNQSKKRSQKSETMRSQSEKKLSPNETIRSSNADDEAGSRKGSAKIKAQR